MSSQLQLFSQSISQLSNLLRSASTAFPEEDFLEKLKQTELTWNSSLEEEIENHFSGTTTNSNSSSSAAASSQTTTTTNCEIGWNIVSSLQLFPCFFPPSSEKEHLNLNSSSNHQISYHSHQSLEQQQTTRRFVHSLRCIFETFRSEAATLWNCLEENEEKIINNNKNLRFTMMKTRIFVAQLILSSIPKPNSLWRDATILTSPSILEASWICCRVSSIILDFVSSSASSSNSMCDKNDNDDLKFHLLDQAILFLNRVLQFSIGLNPSSASLNLHNNKHNNIKIKNNNTNQSQIQQNFNIKNLVRSSLSTVALERLYSISLDVACMLTDVLLLLNTLLYSSSSSKNSCSSSLEILQHHLTFTFESFQLECPALISSFVERCADSIINTSSSSWNDVILKQREMKNVNNNNKIKFNNHISVCSVMIELLKNVSQQQQNQKQNNNNNNIRIARLFLTQGQFEREDCLFDQALSSATFAESQLGEQNHHSNNNNKESSSISILFMLSGVFYLRFKVYCDLFASTSSSSEQQRKNNTTTATTSTILQSDIENEIVPEEKQLNNNNNNTNTNTNTNFITTAATNYSSKALSTLTSLVELSQTISSISCSSNDNNNSSSLVDLLKIISEGIHHVCKRMDDCCCSSCLSLFLQLDEILRNLMKKKQQQEQKSENSSSSDFPEETILKQNEMFLVFWLSVVLKKSDDKFGISESKKLKSTKEVISKIVETLLIHSKSSQETLLDNVNNNNNNTNNEKYFVDAAENFQKNDDDDSSQMKQKQKQQQLQSTLEEYSKKFSLIWSVSQKVLSESTSSSSSDNNNNNNNNKIVETPTLLQLLELSSIYASIGCGVEQQCISLRALARAQLLLKGDVRVAQNLLEKCSKLIPNSPHSSLLQFQLHLAEAAAAATSSTTNNNNNDASQNMNEKTKIIVEQQQQQQQETKLTNILLSDLECISKGNKFREVSDGLLIAAHLAREANFPLICANALKKLIDIEMNTRFHHSNNNNNNNNGEHDDSEECFCNKTLTMLRAWVLCIHNSNTNNQKIDETLWRWCSNIMKILLNIIAKKYLLSDFTNNNIIKHSKISEEETFDENEIDNDEESEKTQNNNNNIDQHLWWCLILLEVVKNISASKQQQQNQASSSNSVLCSEICFDIVTVCEVFINSISEKNSLLMVKNQDDNNNNNNINRLSTSSSKHECENDDNDAAIISTNSNNSINSYTQISNNNINEVLQQTHYYLRLAASEFLSLRSTNNSSSSEIGIETSLIVVRFIKKSLYQFPSSVETFSFVKKSNNNNENVNEDDAASSKKLNIVDQQHNNNKSDFHVWLQVLTTEIMFLLESYASSSSSTSSEMFGYQHQNYNNSNNNDDDEERSSLTATTSSSSTKTTLLLNQQQSGGETEEKIKSLLLELQTKTDDSVVTTSATTTTTTTKTMTMMKIQMLLERSFIDLQLCKTFSHQYQFHQASNICLRDVLDSATQVLVELSSINCNDDNDDTNCNNNILQSQQIQQTKFEAIATFGSAFYCGLETVCLTRDEQLKFAEEISAKAVEICQNYFSQTTATNNSNNNNFYSVGNQDMKQQQQAEAEKNEEQLRCPSVDAAQQQEEENDEEKEKEKNENDDDQNSQNSQKINKTQRKETSSDSSSSFSSNISIPPPILKAAFVSFRAVICELWNSTVFDVNLGNIDRATKFVRCLKKIGIVLRLLHRNVSRLQETTTLDNNTDDDNNRDKQEEKNDDETSTTKGAAGFVEVLVARFQAVTGTSISA